MIYSLNDEKCKHRTSLVQMSSSRTKTPERWTFTRVLVVSFLARVFLVLYAKIHDYMFEVAFTDVDYRVFSDAARLVADGKSPFERATYRYTPFLAWLLTPNVLMADFGKFLFCFLDCATGYMLFKMGGGALADDRVDSPAAFGTIAFWLLNPFIAIISARGSADSLVCCAVLATLFLLQRTYLVSAAAIVHGALAVHLKIYPIIYYPSVFLHLAYRDVPSASVARRPARSLADFVWRCMNNTYGYIFVMLSLLFFCVTIAICYAAYGPTFLDEFLFYHFFRRDIRHNFSPYFYPLYLAADETESSGGGGGGMVLVAKCLGIGAFLPQAVSIVVFAFRYYDDLPFCWFVTTFAFISFNKVCTSQYFIWYLCFLPLVYTRIHLTRRHFAGLAMLWLGAQGVWLLFAYLFEFRGLDTLLYVWLASIGFLFVNSHILATIIRHYRLPQSAEGGDSVKRKTQ